MIKIIPIALFILAFAGCSNDHPDSTSATETSLPAFRIESEQPDQANRAITVNIKFAGPATESEIKSAAEFVIADRKDRYRTVTVNSFLLGATATDKPYTVSTLEGGEITHRFNRQSDSVRIPTH
jgi:hypothetical protein